MTRTREEIMEQARANHHDLILVEVLLDIRGYLGALVKMGRERDDLVLSLVRDLK